MDQPLSDQPLPGHSVLLLPVPPLEAWVRERTRHYDPAFISSDPGFGHAHLTALAPFAAEPTAEQKRAIGSIAAGTAAITVRLARLGQFPNGIIHLRPEPDEPLRVLTDALVAAFPRYRPYGGRYGRRVDPHLTLDAASDTVSIESTRELLADLLPVTCTLTELQLSWWQAGRCHVMQRWPLGGADRPPTR